MKQKNNEASGKLTVERNAKGEVVMPRYNCVTTHTARRSGITNMYLSHKYTIVQMMHVSGHKTQKTFMDYIKLSSDEIADEIDAIANPTQNDVFWIYSNRDSSDEQHLQVYCRLNFYCISLSRKRI